MLKILFGVILILIPFLSVFCFKNRLHGFLYVFGFAFALHITIAFLTQFFHIFLYPVVIAVHSAVALVTLCVLIYKFRPVSFKINLNWFVIFGFLIIIFELWSVHFLYTGTISTVNNNREVSHFSQPYPYFSDEWVGVSLSEYSIDNNALPVINPLFDDNSNNNFPNIFIFFFSLISELLLIISISPISGYVIFSIITGWLICLLVFLLLRANKVGLFPSLLATLSIPFIINGSNLPGIWYLLPFIGGTILFLSGLIGLSINKYFFAWSVSALSVLLYPPIIVFVAPVLIIHLISSRELKKANKIKILLLGFISLILAVFLIIYSQGPNIKDLFNIAIGSIWRPNLENGIVAFYIWRVIPVILIPVALVGLIKIVNKKNLVLITPIAIGSVLWLIYSQTKFCFIIDYARLVVITSFLVVALTGFGFQEIWKKVSETYPYLLKRENILIVKLSLMVVFLILSFSYTDNSGWEKLTLTVNKEDRVYSISPRAPANQYLSKEDIDIFGPIVKKRFISIPWKGLVIGVSTGNYPLESKASIITNKFLSYNEFMEKSCEEKAVAARELDISYVYSSKFNCDKFIHTDQSTEGFHLYQFKP